MPKFETHDDNAFLALDEPNIALIIWAMSSHYSLLRNGRFGRFIEITNDALSLSEIYPIKSKGSRKKTLSMYQLGEWRKTSTVFDPKHVARFRLITESRGGSDGLPPFNIIVMDYGSKRIELNFQRKDRWITSPMIGNASNSQEEMLILRSTLDEAVKRITSNGETNPVKGGAQSSFEPLSEKARAVQTPVQDDPF